MPSKQARAHWREKRTEDLAKFANDTGSEVRWFTQYQARIDGLVDIYPTNGRFHVLSSGFWGSYHTIKDLYKLMSDILDGKYETT